MATAITGTVTRSGTPVSGATVYAIDTETNGVAGMASSDVDGTYAIGGLDTGVRYHITVEWLDEEDWASAKSQPEAVLTTYTPTVTTITVTPNPFTVDVGDTVQLTAVVYDQFDGPMPAEEVTWDSSNDSLATVDSDGLVTGVAEGSVTITATSVTDDTKSGDADGEVEVIEVGFMGSNGAVPLMYEDPDEYADDTEFRGRISDTVPTLVNPALAGTADPLTAFYKTDGGYADMILWEATAGPDGGPALKCTVYGENAGNSSPTPALCSTPPYHMERIWIARDVRYQIGWTNVGDADSSAGISFNATQASGYKSGPHVTAAADGGRSSVEMTGNDYFHNSGAKYGEVNYGFAETPFSVVGSEWSDGLWYTELTLFDYVMGTDGACHAVVTSWRKPQDQPRTAFERWGPKQAYTMEGAPIGGDGVQKIYLWQWLCKNYNQSRSTSLNFYVGKVGMWDALDPNADGSNDPFDTLALDDTQMPFTPPYEPVITSSDAETVVGTVKLTRDYPFIDTSFARFLRPVIDGVDRSDLDIELPYYQSETRVSGLPSGGENAAEAAFEFPLVAGTYDIAMKAVSGDGLQVSGASPEVTNVVVTAGTAPTLTSATPDTATQGDTNIDVTLIGSDFESGDDAIFSNSDITVNSTTFVDSTELTANIDVDLTASTGGGTVLVRNATNGDSNTQPFTVNAVVAFHWAWVFQDNGSPVTSPPAYAIVVNDPNNTGSPFPYPQNASGKPDWGLYGFSGTDHARTRDAAAGQLGGMESQVNNGTDQAQLQIAVPNGTFDVNLALGDIAFGANNYCYIYDDTTLLASVVGVANTSSNVINLAGSSVAYTGWSFNTGKSSLVFSTGICRVKFGSPTAQSGSSCLVTFELNQTA